MPSPAIHPVICAICNTDFRVGRQRFETSKSFTCSKMCLAELRSRNVIAYRGSSEARVTHCDGCGDRIERKPSQIAKYARNFCGRACRAVGIRGPNLKLVTGAWHPCDGCDTQVWRTPATLGPRTYCSHACSNNAPRTARVERVLKPCAHCSEQMTLLPSEAARYRFCSWRCAAGSIQGAKRGLPGKPWTDEAKVKLSATLQVKWAGDWLHRIDRLAARMSGEGNPRYRDGSTRTKYAPGFTRSLKRRIAARDNYVCQLCGAPEGEIAHPVHHLDGKKVNHDPSNLVLLCNPCHGKLHHWMDKIGFLDAEPGAGYRTLIVH